MTGPFLILVTYPDGSTGQVEVTAVEVSLLEPIPLRVHESGLAIILGDLPND